jgi:hypothetical protein
MSGWFLRNVYAVCSEYVVGLVLAVWTVLWYSCRDVPQYKVMKYLVFGIISSDFVTL